MAGDIRLKRTEQADYKEIPGRLKIEYMHSTRDPTQRNLEGLLVLLRYFQSPTINIDELLRKAADLIQRQFGIDNVAIGLRDPKDGLYRYRVMVGFRDEAVLGHRQIAYKYEEFFGTDEFQGHDISKYSRLYLAEENVLTNSEKKAYNRPALFTMKRRTPTDSLEGDYVDTKILGTNDKLLGWIEISGTRLMKLPDAETLRWIETIGCIIGAALVCQER